MQKFVLPFKQKQVFAHYKPKHRKYKVKENKFYFKAKSDQLEIKYRCLRIRNKTQGKKRSRKHNLFSSSGQSQNSWRANTGVCSPPLFFSAVWPDPS